MSFIVDNLILIQYMLSHVLLIFTQFESVAIPHPFIEYAFIRCLVFVSLFKYRILFMFFFTSFWSFIRFSLLYAASHIHIRCHKVDFKGFKRNTVARKRLLLLFVVHMSFSIFLAFRLNILLSNKEMIENSELIKGKIPKWIDSIFDFFCRHFAENSMKSNEQ